MIVLYSRYFPQTRREASSQRDVATPGFTMLERGGFVRSAGAAGIYSLLPLGWRVHRKVCDIIFDEMERHGVLNLQLPILQPKEYWEQTGRWKTYVETKTMFRTKEEHRQAEFGLAPTAEEMVTALVAGDVKSWRELPLSLHQIGPKFRGELRPRLGLLRTREFVMSDAYSFDRDEDGMRASFQRFRDIYQAIFERVGLTNVVAVQADSGAIGGSGSAEFMAISDVGEDTLLTCDTCDYGANAEKADSRYTAPAADAELRPMRKVETPGVKTVEQLEALFPTLRADGMVKTLIYRVAATDPDTHLIALCIRGDLSANETKLSNMLGRLVETATELDILEATGAPVGFAGPINLRGIERIYFDGSVEGLTNFLCGVNEEDVHALDVNFGRDLAEPTDYVELHLAKGGDGCPNCDGLLRESRGIELGHVFMLQRGYAESLGARFSTEDGGDATMWMGCYGIGTTRLVQAIAELFHDSDGLQWPAPVSPFDVAVVLTRPDDAAQQAALALIAGDLDGYGFTALVDDRAVSPGVKFKDADLIGCPRRITIGRDVTEGLVEVKHRPTGATSTVAIADAGTMVRDLL
jgi:prolyl-tRNA synthetase